MVLLRIKSCHLYKYMRITRLCRNDERTAVHTDIDRPVTVRSLYLLNIFNKMKICTEMNTSTNKMPNYAIPHFNLCVRYIYPTHTCIAQSTATRMIILDAILSLLNFAVLKWRASVNSGLYRRYTS